MLKKKEQESGGKFFRLTVNDRLSAQSLGGGGGGGQGPDKCQGPFKRPVKTGC